MITGIEAFLMTFLGCGEYDLRLIDDVEYDWCDVLEQVDFSCLGDRRLSAIMHAVFNLGKDELNEAIRKRIDYLEDTQEAYGISEEQKAELEALRELNPFEDLEEYHNYLDTYVTCVAHQDTYRTYLKEELRKFAERTGFEIEMIGDSE